MEIDEDEFWGPAIEVDGVRPQWLTGQVVCDVWTGSHWVTRSFKEPHENPAENWAWTHSDGSACITKIRLPKDHWCYNRYSFEDAKIEVVFTDPVEEIVEKICSFLESDVDTYPSGTYTRCREMASYWKAAAEDIRAGRWK